MRHVLIEGTPSPGQDVVLDEATSHHLLRVRRLRRESPVLVMDGAGRQAPATFIGVTDGLVCLRIDGIWVERPASRPVHLVWAVPKGPALEAGLRMAVEAGVTDVHLTLGTHSVPRSDRRERWQRVIDSACAQCGRPDRPRLTPLQTTVAAALDHVPAAIAGFVAAPGSPVATVGGDARAIAVGPEGGFSKAELDVLFDRGWTPLALGPYILRSDTAVAVGVSALARD